MTRKMPAQKPGTSNQVVQTPPEFIRAVETMFGPMAYDLAALKSNRVTEDYYGPDHPIESRRDSLTATWPKVSNCWLNPPYNKIGPWADKCADARSEDHSETLHIFMLVPASVGSKWFDLNVTHFADVYSIGRLTFVGHKNPYPKDLLLCHYWFLGGNKFERWDWNWKRK